MTRSAYPQAPTGFLYLGDFAYEYLDYQITVGAVTPDFVLRQPYQADILEKLSDRKTVAQYYISLQRLWVNNDYLNFQFMPENRLKFQEGHWRNRYAVTGGVHYAGKHILLANRTSLRQEYKYDPFYAGDLSESAHWLYGRVNDAYMFCHWKCFWTFIGKLKRNWGPINESGLILSDNPYSYNHMAVGYQNGRLALSVIFARLEDLASVGYFPENTQNRIVHYPNARKYLVGHRMDLRLHHNFQIGLTEMAT